MSPASSFKLLIIPIILYAICTILGIKPNPFEPMLFISYYLPNSAPDDPRYGKGFLDIVFIAYHIIVFSFIRQFSLFKIIFPIARRLGIRKQAKLDRFGEQAYSMLYYGGMGLWGAVSAIHSLTPRRAQTSNTVHHEETADLVVSNRVLLDRYVTIIELVRNFLNLWKITRIGKCCPS